LVNTRWKVSWLRIPSLSSRNWRKKGSLERPHSAMASHPPAPAITAQVAVVRMSASVWVLLAVSVRGFGRSANTLVRVRAIGSSWPP
jgi:hypothetical protein